MLISKPQPSSGRVRVGAGSKAEAEAMWTTHVDRFACRGHREGNGNLNENENGVGLG